MLSREYFEKTVRKLTNEEWDAFYTQCISNDNEDRSAIDGSLTLELTPTLLGVFCAARIDKRAFDEDECCLLDDLAQSHSFNKR